MGGGYSTLAFLSSAVLTREIEQHYIGMLKGGPGFESHGQAPHGGSDKPTAKRGMCEFEHL